uniref:Uncharacterized protein n=1 Tax=Anguilla anguilla TaxID=7936 RepID=A0A0E9PR03_ANGAN
MKNVINPLSYQLIAAISQHFIILLHFLWCKRPINPLLYLCLLIPDQGHG